MAAVLFDLSFRQESGKSMRFRRGKSTVVPPGTAGLGGCASALAVLVLALAMDRQSHAAVVVNTNDAGAGSLRQAILDANANGGGNITFSTNVTGTIVLLSPLPSLAANLMITGPGTNLLTISGNNQVAIFSMNPGTTNTLSGLTIANGFAEGSDTNIFATLAYASGISNAGTLTLSSCLLRNCTNNLSYGQGVYNAGDLEMDACGICDCSYLSVPYFENLTYGGAIYNGGTLRMSNCSISRCSGFSEGAAGAGIWNQGSLTLTASVIEACKSEGESDGGAIYSPGPATLTDCILSNCLGWDGAGIKSWGELILTNTWVVGNEALDAGGGISLAGGTAVLVGCTISGNTALYGGGIANLGILDFYNCTIAQNGLLELSGQGAGIHGGTNYLDHCTMASNLGPEIAGTGFFGCQNSILDDCPGTMYSDGYNLLVSTNGCAILGNAVGNIYGVDPLLGPLQNNGGPTPTMALLAGSPAIDQGSAGGLTTDQRGLPRPFVIPYLTQAADGSDIGAFEVEGGPPFFATQPPTPQVVQQGANVSFAVTVLGDSPLSCQWQFDGTNLSDGAQISGATTTNLMITGVPTSVSGIYRVVVSNALGSLISSEALLTVLPQLVLNGSFETGDFSDWTPGGNVTNCEVTNAADDVHSGQYGARLNASYTLGYLSQNLPTLAGQAYLLSFWLSVAEGGQTNEFLVAWNGTTLFDQLNLPTNGWTNLEFMVQASGSNSVLEFGFQDDGAAFGLDDITVSAAPQLVLNGGFETGDFSHWALSGLAAGTAVITNADDVHSGTYGAQLQASGGWGSISSKISTAPSQSYLLSFWLSNFEGGLPNQFTATWDGATLVNEVDLPSSGWTNLQFLVTATGSSSALEFDFRDDPAALGLDDISLTPIPTIQGIAQAGNTITLTWSTVQGGLYQVQSTTNLAEANWISLGNPVAAASGSASASDTAGADAQRFYRVVLLP